MLIPMSQRTKIQKIQIIYQPQRNQKMKLMKGLEIILAGLIENEKSSNLRSSVFEKAKR